MSIWQEMVNLSEFRQTQSIYNDQFPLEVRYLCAEWIENEIVSENNNENYSQKMNCERSVEFVKNLIRQLEEKKLHLTNVGDFVTKFRIIDWITKCTQNVYSPIEIYQQIRQTILSEQHFLAAQQINSAHSTFMDAEYIEIEKNQSELYRIVQINAENLNICRSELDHYRCTQSNLSIYERNQNSANNPAPNGACYYAVVKLRQKIPLITEQLIYLNYEILTNTTRAIDLIEAGHEVIVNVCLVKWKREQAKIDNNDSHSLISNLDHIQIWLDNLMHFVKRTKEVIEIFRSSIYETPLSNRSGSEIFTEEWNRIIDLFKKLIASAFIVEEQPPQVIKTNTR